MCRNETSDQFAVFLCLKESVRVFVLESRVRTAQWTVTLSNRRTGSSWLQPDTVLVLVSSLCTKTRFTLEENKCSSSVNAPF